MRVMGLDASSTTIGYSILDYDGKNIKLIHCDFYKPPKNGDIFERLSQVQQFISDLVIEWKPDEVALEDIVLFMKGKSTAKTITMLAVVNRTVGLAVYHNLASPHLLNVLKIRHSIKKDHYPDKTEIPELVAEHLKIDFPYTYIQKGKKKGEIAVESYDCADSIAVALAFLFTEVVEPSPSKTLKRSRRKAK